MRKFYQLKTVDSIGLNRIELDSKTSQNSGKPFKYNGLVDAVG